MAETDNPGRRLDNPLGALSSYTYQLSLYMISPDAYDAFVATGRRTIDALQAGGAGGGTSGAYLIAQSGGINNTKENRGAGFEKDLYIENLEIEHVSGSNASQSATGTYSVKFNITEPYSFSFTTKLREASSAIIKAFPDRFSSGKNPGLTNGSRQFFILGIKFLGYDTNGNLAIGNEVTMEDGQVIDQNATGGGGSHLFETYYDISITAIKFKIDGNATSYACSGVALAPSRAFSTQGGRLKSAYTIKGSTLEEMYMGPDGLFTQINNAEKLQTEGDDKTQEYANQYILEFIGDDGDSLSKASMLNPGDLDKSKWASPPVNAKNPESDNKGATSNPNDSKREVIFKIDDPILETFDTLIKTSSYMLDALQVLYQNSVAPDLDTGKAKADDGSSQKKLGWYHITPVISDAKWDGLSNDWAYTMTYRIETYQTPIVEVSATNPGVDYYGPHKRYEYWWTGQNKEILEYSQQLDNLFYNETIGNISKNENDASTSVNVATAKQRSAQPSINAVGQSDSVQNAYITSLYSPDSYANAKIKILGDPDFFIEDHRGGPNEPYQRFYGNDGFRINANGGQIFFEIDFKEAVDYNDTTGVMDINESILFFKYPDWVKDKVKGVSYKLIKVKSNFSDGVFTQQLEAVLNSFSDTDPNAKRDGDNGDGREDTSAETAGTASLGARIKEGIFKGEDDKNLLDNALGFFGFGDNDKDKKKEPEGDTDD